MKDIESYSDDDLKEELEARGYLIEFEVCFDYTDQQLFSDIYQVFEASSTFDRQKIRDLIVNFK